MYAGGMNADSFSLAGRSAVVEGYRYRLPFTAPVRVGGDAHDHRDGLLVRICAGDREGWGDVAPLPGFSETSLASAIKACRRWAEAETVRDARVEWGDGRASIHRPGPALPPSAAFGVEQALLTLAAHPHRKGIVDVLGEPRRRSIPINALTSAATDAVLDDARALCDAGYETIKIKVGRVDLETEAQRIRQVQDAVGADVAVRLDANRAWTPAAARRMANALGKPPIAYVEEPLADPSGLPSLVVETGWRVALDETVREIAPTDLSDHAYATAIVLKPSLMGLDASLRWMDAAADRGIRVVLSSAYESGVGLRMLIALAARTPTTEAAGFGPYRRLAADVLAPRLPLDGPSVDIAAIDAARPMAMDRLDRVF